MVSALSYVNYRKRCTVETMDTVCKTGKGNNIHLYVLILKYVAHINLFIKLHTIDYFSKAGMILSSNAVCHTW